MACASCAACCDALAPDVLAPEFCRDRLAGRSDSDEPAVQPKPRGKIPGDTWKLSPFTRGPSAKNNWSPGEHAHVEAGTGSKSSPCICPSGTAILSIPEALFQSEEMRQI